jgi:hypothetical protein
MLLCGKVLQVTIESGFQTGLNILALMDASKNIVAFIAKLFFAFFQIRGLCFTMTIMSPSHDPVIGMFHCLFIVLKIPQTVLHAI